MIAALASLALPSLASAAPGEITEFQLAAGNDWPEGITAGPEGDLWFAEWGSGAIGRITPGGQITEFALPTGSEPFKITTGPEGDLWFTEPGKYEIGRIAPSGEASEFPVAAEEGYEPQDITAGPDGNLWFTERQRQGQASSGARIGRITPAGQIAEFPLSCHACGLEGITAGPEGDLWFTRSGGVESGPGAIGRVTPAGQITEFPLRSEPSGITSGPNGNLWFTILGGLFLHSGIGRITPAGQVTEFSSVNGSSGPHPITAGLDGNLWFYGNTMSRYPNPGEPEVCRVVPPGGKVTRFIPHISVPESSVISDRVPSDYGGIAAGPEGDLWFTMPSASLIGRITPGPQAKLAVEIETSRALAHHRWLKMKLSCGGGPAGSPCRGLLSLRFWGSRAVLAKRRYSLRSESQATVPLRLTRWAFRLLRRDREMIVSATATLRGGRAAAGELILRLPARRKRHRR